MYTDYAEINQLLEKFKSDVISILSDNLIGIYLFGSLTYGDFEPGRSDIDISVITNTLLTPTEYKKIEKLHKIIEKNYPNWQGRLECSYTPLSYFKSPVPPRDRPYWGQSEFYMATYGNEWIINNFLLQEYGVTIYGKPFANVCPRILISQVQEACKKDLLKEWEPKLNDDLWLADPHYQSYLVLNLCRILHTIINGQASSKNASALWVKTKFPQWRKLINQALAWKYGEVMNSATETKKFLSFTLDNAN